MRSAPALSFLRLLLPCLCVTLPAQMASKPKDLGPAAIALSLPDAYSGVPYNTRLVGALGLATGDYRCGDPQPALPDGLSFTCAAAIKIVGTPTTSDDLQVHSSVQVTDVLDHSVNLELSFTLRPAVETVVVGGPKPPASTSRSPYAPQRTSASAPSSTSDTISLRQVSSPQRLPLTSSPSGTSTSTGKPPVPTAAQTPPVDPSKVSFVQTTPVAENVSTIKGQITPALGKTAAAKLKVEAWIESPGQPRTLALLKPPSGGDCCTTSVQQIALAADSTYSLTFLKPLVPGQTVTLMLVDADRREIKDSGPLALRLAIDVGKLNLQVKSEIIAGATSISGSVNMPPNPIAADPKATPPVVGNFPQIAVWVKDADLGLWSQAPLQVSGSTAPLQPVTSDGTFTVTLKNALKSGQKVRVDALPATGRTFADLPPLPPPPDEAPANLSFLAKVKSSTVLVQPSISTTLTEGTTVISGIATPPGTGSVVSVAVLKIEPRVEQIDSDLPPNRKQRAGSGPSPDPAVPVGPASVAFHPPAVAPGSKAPHSSPALYPDRRDDLTAVCIDADQLSQYRDGGSHGITLAKRGRLLTINSSGSNVLLAAVDQSGTFKLTLNEALKEDDQIQIVQVLPAGTNLADPQYSRCASPVQKVRYAFDWHRTNLNFVAGVLISNSSTSAANANFSQANQFYAFNLDRAWNLPGVDCVGGVDQDNESRRHRDANGNLIRTPKSQLVGRAFGRERYGPCRGSGWHASLMPGINTYFEGRLTSIPVSTPTANPTMTSSSGATTTSGTGSTTVATGSGATATTGAATTPATPPPSSLLTSQKVFRVSAGLFFPWVLGHGPGHHPNAIFFAPIIKGGFDTVTGATSSPNVVLPGGMPGTLSYQHAYNFFAFGGRLGNMELSASHDRAPKIDHYLDVTVGRYSNLQSFICHQPFLYPQRGAIGALPGSSCFVDYTQAFPGGSSTVLESRKQLFRLDFEGLVKVPVPATAIPFYIGFNANIAQHTVGAESLDHAYAPPDDIRILFGTKIDMGALLTTLKLGPN